MNWFTGVVLYALIWWIALFAVLPIGTRTITEADPTSGWRGAPTRPRLGRKVLATSIIAAAIWLGFYMVIRSPWFSFRTGWLALPND